MTVTKADIQRGVTVSIAALLTAFFGFASVTSAQVASITNTGPGSNNQIKSNNSQDCSVYNKNNLNVNNSNHQYASTGDANVGGSWGAYNPAVWAAQGHSYAEWQAAVTSHMSTYQNNWGHSSGGNTNAGSATTGDASNHNSTNVSFAVNNGGAGGFCDFMMPGGGSGSIHTSGPGSNNQITSHSSVDSHLVNKNNLGVNNSSHQGAESGDANVSGNTNAGGAGSGHAKNANGTSVHGSVTNGGLGGGGAALGGGGSGGGGAGAAGGGCSGSIGTTGPSSNNQIKCNTSVNTSVTNRNNLSLYNTNYQTATSGSANVSGNTNAGSATTGSAANTNTTSASFSVNN